MDDFKSNTKMQCFKEGGSVQYKSRRSATMSESKDIAEDKKIVKKAIAMHDAQEHKGEKTDLSKLKKGGRAKKELGTARKFIKPAAAPSGAKKEPNKYKTGGSVANVYEAKKKAGDLDNIQKVKEIKAVKLCGGKSVRKMANGGNLPAPTPMAQAGSQQAALLNALPGKASEIERAQMAARARNALKYLGPAQQSEFVNQGGMTPAPRVPAQKRGGKVKK